MDSRQNYLSHLQNYIEGVDKEITFILQSLQWDRKHLLETVPLVTCKYDSNHKIPPDKIECHERECFLKSQGYSKDERMLPKPFDPCYNTVVKFTTENIKTIINDAASKDTSFKIGEGIHGNQDTQPLTDDRLRSTYTADERRAIYEAVVAAVPSCHDLSDLALALPGTTGAEDGHKTKPKSRAEVLAELRDMKRRRAKYRVAAKTKNYSDVLRDVIKTQMEFYTETQENIRIKSLTKDDKTNNSYNNSETENNESKEMNRKRNREHSRSKDTRNDRTREEMRSDRQREEVPYKRSRDSDRRSESRYKETSRSYNNDRYGRFNSKDDRNYDRYKDSRREKESDRHRNRDARYSDGHSRGYDSNRYNERHNRHHDSQTNRTDRRSKEDYKERRLREDAHDELIDVKKEIKEEFDSNSDEDRSKHKHKSKKSKKHKMHKRRSKSKEGIIKVKEEKSSPRSTFEDY